MEVLPWIWRGVLAFDRVGTRIPQLIQIWLVELFAVLPLAFFVGKVIDIRGCCGVEGTHERLAGVFWGCLVVGLVCFGFFLRSVFRPRLVQGEWTPVQTPTFGDVTLAVPNRRWAVSYDYLTSHPSYALLLLLTLPIPGVMLLASRYQGDETFYYRTSGWAGVAIIVLMTILRLVSWYVLRLGRDEVDATPRLAWEIAWKPVLVLVTLMYAIVAIPISVMFVQQHRTIAALPVVQPDSRAGSYFRVVGDVVGEPVFWKSGTGGRGGNNYSGGGVLVHLDRGGEVLFLAESLAVPDLRGVLAKAEDGRIHSQGVTQDGLTEDQTTYYGFDLDDFPPPDAGGRSIVVLNYP